MTVANRDAEAAASLELQSLASRINAETEAGYHATRAGSAADTGRAIEAGRLLLRAKQIVGATDWPDWLAANTGLHGTAADSLMCLAREWPAIAGLKPHLIAAGCRVNAISELRLADALAELAQFQREASAIPVREFYRILGDLRSAGEPPTIHGMLERWLGDLRARESVEPRPAPMPEPVDLDEAPRPAMPAEPLSVSASDLMELAALIPSDDLAGISAKLRREGKLATADELAGEYAAFLRAQDAPAPPPVAKRSKPWLRSIPNAANIAGARAAHLRAVGTYNGWPTERNRAAAYAWGHMAGKGGGTNER